MMDRISLALIIIGALNWGSIGLFQFDIIAWIFGGQAAAVSRVLYVIVDLAGILCLSILFKRTEEPIYEDRWPKRFICSA